MEFGIFAQLFVPRYERDVDPMAEHKRIMRNIEVGVAADRTGIKYVWCPEHHFLDEYSHMPGPEVYLSYLAGPHRAGARGLGHLQHHAQGEPPGPRGRDGGPDGPHHRGPLRVRHRPRLVDDRGLRLRHRRPRRDHGDVGRVDPRDPEDVEGRPVRLRGHLLPHAAPRGLPQALRRRAPADVGRRRQPAHVRQGRLDGSRRLLLHPRHAQQDRPADRCLQGRRRHGRAGRRLRERQHHGRHQHDLHGGPRGGLRDRRQHRA